LLSFSIAAIECAAIYDVSLCGGADGIVYVRDVATGNKGME
jgi:hypothetical protein